MDIKGFFGSYRWLSNFWAAKVVLDGVEYPSIENAFQAAKTTDKELRKQFENCTPGMAKRLGQQVKLRDNWENIKLDVMYNLCYQKFSRPTLKMKLLKTSGYLEETNSWGDEFWGVFNEKGENNLGKIIMEIREKLRAAQCKSE